MPQIYAGNTVQVWALVAVMAVCVSTIVRLLPQGLRSGEGVALGGLLVCTVSGALGGASVAGLAEGVGKIALPLLLVLYFSRLQCSKFLVRFALAANVFTLGQAALAWILTGSFSANRYYLDLPEEYFGYFYHPFAFSGLLSVFSLVVVHEIRMRRRRGLMTTLLLVNLGFIAATQVRTYALAVGIALLVAGVGFTIGKRRPMFTIVVAIALSVSAVLGVGSSLSGSRTTVDTSSGRLDRWLVDLKYVWDTASPGNLLFGGGPGRIGEVNEVLFGVNINSLNAFIDLFVDFGLLGMLSILSAWILILVSRYRESRDTLVLCVITMLALTAAVTSPLEFPAVSAMLALGLYAVDSEQSAREIDESPPTTG